MNRYQKVITCVIRFLSVALLLYSAGVTLVARLLSAQIWKLSLLTTVPMFVLGLLLFLGAIPLSKLITLGIRED